MAWVATDDFNYTNGDLNAQNGGSGWSAAWSGSTNYDVQSTVLFGALKAIEIINANTTEFEIGRTLTTAVTDGSVHIAMRRNSTSRDIQDFWLNEGGITISSRVCGVQFLTTGQIAAVGSASNNQQAYAIDTWYEFDIEFDCSTDQFRVSIDGGAFSSWYGFRTVETTLTAVNFYLNSTTSLTNTNYWADLRPSAAVAATSTPTLMMLGVGS